MSLRIVAGKYKGRILQTPKGTSTRPTQGMLREAVFNICQAEVENALVLDLFAGSGAIGFEALSRGASHVTFVESEKRAIQCIERNREILQAEAETSLIPFPVEKALKHLTKPFDIIYVDPPYDLPTRPILEKLLTNNLLKRGSLLFLEERRDAKNKEKPWEPERLFLKSSRHFGTATLHQYVCVS